MYTTTRGSNFYQRRKTCKYCKALLQVERRSERGSLDGAQSEEAFSQGTMQTDAAAEEKWIKLEPTQVEVEQAGICQVEAKWSKLACAYAAHAKVMARAQPGRAKQALAASRHGPASSALKAKQRQIVFVLFQVILAFILVLKDSETAP